MERTPPSLAATPEGARSASGCTLKSLRVSMDPLGLLADAGRSVRDLRRRAAGQRAPRRAASPPARGTTPTWRRAAEARRCRRPRAARCTTSSTTTRCGDYLASLDVSVLPYRFGTHSGWLEACRDLGTAVVAPTCGYYADQGPVLPYVHDEHHLDPASCRGGRTRRRRASPPGPRRRTPRRSGRRIAAAPRWRSTGSVVDAEVRVCVIASAATRSGEPFAGGLEAHTHALAGALVARGHDVSLFAAPGSDPSLRCDELAGADVHQPARGPGRPSTPPARRRGWPSTTPTWA